DAVDEQHERCDRQHVLCGRTETREQLPYQIHDRSVPYAMTKIIGIAITSAMVPKPSLIALRPASDDASPMPSAVTSGTVMTDVVTPPESYAMPTMAGGARGVIATTTANVPRTSGGSGQPKTIRTTPSVSAHPTASATTN